MYIFSSFNVWSGGGESRYSWHLNILMGIVYTHTHTHTHTRTHIHTHTQTQGGASPSLFFAAACARVCVCPRVAQRRQV